MRKTHKRILGLFGLVVVVATTVFAACLPGPGATAVSSVVDTITVRVVSTGPNVDILTPSSGGVTTESKQEIKYNYENVDTVRITVEYTDEEGAKHTYVMDTFTPEQDIDTGTFTLDMTDVRFGFGDYVVRITGTNSETGGEDGDTVSFTHIPVTTEIEEDKKTGEIYAVLDYDETDDSIKKIELNIYDKDGNLVEGISPIIVDSPTKKVVLPFEEYGVKAGDYVIKTTALGEDGEPLYKDYDVDLKYDTAGVPDTDGEGDKDKSDVDVPDTGGLFAGLNISKSDYLITGLAIFFLTGITGLFFIIRKKNKR